MSVVDLWVNVELTGHWRITSAGRYFPFLLSACSAYGCTQHALRKPLISEPHRSSTFDTAKIYFNDIVSKSYLLLHAFKHNKLKRLADGPLRLKKQQQKNNVINLFKNRRISANCARMEIKLSSRGEHQLKAPRKMQQSISHIGRNTHTRWYELCI